MADGSTATGPVARAEPATPPEPDGPEKSEQQPERIADNAAGEGRERLDRSNLDIFVTALIGGGEVSLGGLAAMTLTGAALAAVPTIGFHPALAIGGLAFPIGFMFVIIGRSELFTENFLVPVVSVYNGERSLRSLLEVWGLSWLGNIIATAVTAALIVLPHTVGEPILEAYRTYSEHKLALETPTLLASAVLAGATMTILTWMLQAVRDVVGKILLIFATGYLLFAANLAHSIVGAAVLFGGFALTPYSLLDVLRWVALATVGNLVGGVGLVTLFRLVQVKEKQRHEAEDGPPAR